MPWTDRKWNNPYTVLATVVWVCERDTVRWVKKLRRLTIYRQETETWCVCNSRCRCRATTTCSREPRALWLNPTHGGSGWELERDWEREVNAWWLSVAAPYQTTTKKDITAFLTVWHSQPWPPSSWGGWAISWGTTLFPPGGFLFSHQICLTPLISVQAHTGGRHREEMRLKIKWRWCQSRDWIRQN